MRGDKSVPPQDLHASHPPIGCDSRTFQRFAPPNQPKTSLHGNRRPKSEERFHTPNRRLPCREVRGGSGRLGGWGDPYERGLPAPPRSFLTQNEIHTPATKCRYGVWIESARFHPTLSLIRVWLSEKSGTPTDRIGAFQRSGSFSGDTVTRRNISLPAEAGLQTFCA